MERRSKSNRLQGIHAAPTAIAPGQRARSGSVAAGSDVRTEDGWRSVARVLIDVGVLFIPPRLSVRLLGRLHAPSPPPADRYRRHPDVRELNLWPQFGEYRCWCTAYRFRDRRVYVPYRAGSARCGRADRETPSGRSRLSETRSNPGQPHSHPTGGRVGPLARGSCDGSGGVNEGGAYRDTSICSRRRVSPKWRWSPVADETGERKKGRANEGGQGDGQRGGGETEKL